MSVKAAWTIDSARLSVFEPNVLETEPILRRQKRPAVPAVFGVAELPFDFIAKGIGVTLLFLEAIVLAESKLLL